MTYNIENLRVTQSQKDLAAYIKRETNKVVKPESIALVDALRAEFRKDPERVAERERVKAAADERRRAALEKKLAQARKLAEQLGLDLSALPPVSEPDAPAPKSVPVAASAPAPVKADDGFEEDDSPVASVTPIRAVENDFGGDTSALDVIESQDGWVTDEATDDFEEDF